MNSFLLDFWWEVGQIGPKAIGHFSTNEINPFGMHIAHECVARADQWANDAPPKYFHLFI